jgi:hypothetical protein
MSWLSLDGEPWVSLIPGSQEFAGFRFEHLGTPGDPHILTADDLPVLHYPSDGGSPCRLRDLQVFRSWADQRRVGPQPGVELALGLFIRPPDLAPFGNYSSAVWRAAVSGERGMDAGLVVIMIMTGDANIAGRLSVAHTRYRGPGLVFGPRGIHPELDGHRPHRPRGYGHRPAGHVSVSRGRQDGDAGHRAWEGSTHKGGADLHESPDVGRPRG